MHLPFTYATGEALLYQSNHPIAGFRDGSHEKNSSKSKKSRTDRLVSGVDPGSLLGALMSQDVSVYVSQPAVEPKVSFHSSFFDQMGFAVSEPSSLHRSWDEPSNGVPEPSTSFDPLLATLDSLSLEGQGVVDSEAGSCSNGELFGALEGLGLSAEDLELLLLDERMIRVEMDPEHVPTLDDLLTNDEILSYIYDSIDGKTDSTEHEGQLPPSTSAAAATAASPTPTDTNMQVSLPHHRLQPVGQTPILQLSQQMQKHLSVQTGKVTRDWGPQTGHLPNAIVNGELLGQDPPVANGQWSAQDILTRSRIQVDHFNPQQTVFNGKTSELEGGFLQQHQHYLQQQPPPLMQNQLSHQCHAKQKAANLNGLCEVSSTEHPTGKSQWQDYGFSESLGGIDVSQKPLTNTSLDSCTDYSMPGIDNVDYAVSGSGLFGRTGQQHESPVSSFQGLNHKKQQQQQQEQILVPLAQVISSLSQCPPPNASLEQILGVSKSCRQLDQYSVVTSEIPHDPVRSKVRLQKQFEFCFSYCIKYQYFVLELQRVIDTMI